MKRDNMRSALNLGIPAMIVSILLTGFGVTHASTLATRQTGDGLIVDLVTDPPRLAAGPDLPDGFFRVSIDDLASTHEPGSPELPYRTVLVGVPAGRSVQVEATSRGGTRLGTFRLAPFAPRGGWEPGEESAGPAGAADLEAVEDPAVYGARAPFPPSLAVVAGTGMIRDQEIAEIRVFPVQYDPADSGIVHHPRIQVRIRFVEDTAARLPARLDPDPETGPRHLRAFDGMLHSLVNYPMVKLDREATRARLANEPSPVTDGALAAGPASLAGATGMVKLYVKSDGIYDITPADLTAAGVDLTMVDPATFRMTAGGQDVAIGLFDGGDNLFDGADHFLFYGQGIKGDRYTRTNVYQLSYGSTAGPRMISRDGSFSGQGSTPTSFATTVHAETDRLYTQIIRPGVNEAWYWQLQLEGDPNSDPRNYAITVPHPDPAPHTINIRAHMLGIGNGLHAPRLSLNGTQVDDGSFSGQILYTQAASDTSALLLTGANTINLDLLPNGNPSDRIAVDWFEIDYLRTYAADNDALEFEGQQVGKQRFEISNFSIPFMWLLDITNPLAPQFMTSEPVVQVGMTYTLPFEDHLTSTHRYVAASALALKKPASIVLDDPSNLMSSSNGADYIIITDRSLLTAMEPLRLLRQSQGLRAVTVATDDIYDEFNFGRFDPNAIRSFLAYAYANWTAPAPAYVVLAGDGHVDYRDDFGSGTPQVVPPLLAAFATVGEAPSDNNLVAVSGNDVFPEMFVGRLPIRSVADANTIVTNIINYETSPPTATLNQHSLFVADNNDVIFQAIQNNLQAFLPTTMVPIDAYLPGGDPNNPPTQPQVNATTDTVIDALDAGVLLSIYMGHGNVDLWAKEKILQHNPNPPTGSSGRLDLDRLVDSGNQTFMVAMNCINGYFVDLLGAGPGHVDYSLMEEFLRRPNRGAIAGWTPAATGQLREYDGMAYELFDNLFTQGENILGPASVSAVVEAVSVFGVDTSNVESMTFFGDPATTFAVDYSQCATAPPEVHNLEVARSGADIVLTWDVPLSVPCATYKIYAAENTGLPKNSFTPYVEVGSTATGTFTHVGAATDGVDYDYLVVISHPTYGLGPLGHYGLF